MIAPALESALTDCHAYGGRLHKQHVMPLQGFAVMRVDAQHMQRLQA